MSDPFVAEIRVFGFNFAPTGWAVCNGQLLPISQNTALFSLIGTYYGGDGKSTFALPNLTGRVPMAPGQGSGLSLHDLGESGGQETVTLLESELPSHTHGLSSSTAVTTGLARHQAPSADVALGRSDGFKAYAAGGPAGSGGGLAPAGGNLPHNNLMPYLTLNFCIALQGVFPPRS